MRALIPLLCGITVTGAIPPAAADEVPLSELASAGLPGLWNASRLSDDQKAELLAVQSFEKLDGSGFLVVPKVGVGSNVRLTRNDTITNSLADARSALGILHGTPLLDEYERLEGELADARTTLQSALSDPRIEASTSKAVAAFQASVDAWSLALSGFEARLLSRSVGVTSETRLVAFARLARAFLAGGLAPPPYDSIEFEEEFPTLYARLMASEVAFLEIDIEVGSTSQRALLANYVQDTGVASDFLPTGRLDVRTGTQHGGSLFRSAVIKERDASNADLRVSLTHAGLLAVERASLSSSGTFLPLQIEAYPRLALPFAKVTAECRVDRSFLESWGETDSGQFMGRRADTRAHASYNRAWSRSFSRFVVGNDACTLRSEGIRSQHELEDFVSRALPLTQTEISHGAATWTFERPVFAGGVITLPGVLCIKKNAGILNTCQQSE